MSLSSSNTSSQADYLQGSAMGTRNLPTERPPARDASAAQQGTLPGNAVQANPQTGASQQVKDSEKTGDGTNRQDPNSLEKVQQAMEEVRKAISPVAQDLLFSIDQDTGKTVIKVMDASTDELIRQIPSEEILSIAKALDKLQGLLIEQKA